MSKKISNLIEVIFKIFIYIIITIFFFKNNYEFLQTLQLNLSRIKDTLKYNIIFPKSRIFILKSLTKIL